MLDWSLFTSSGASIKAGKSIRALIQEPDLLLDCLAATVSLAEAFADERMAP
jgi:hypothetical protein